jgi:Fic family protein
MADWNAFDFRLRFEAGALREDLINIEAYRLSLNRLHLPREWKADLQKLYIVRAVHGTTAIEGNPLSEGEVRSFLAQGPNPSKGSSDQVHRQTQNAAGAFRWIEENFRESRPLRLEDILTIHRMLTTGSDEHENVPGRLREGGHNVTVGNPDLGGVHVAPPGGETTCHLMERYIAFVNSQALQGQHPVVRALIAHFYFVTLHPFGNGNGRTTRCIEAAMLYSGNTYGFYSLSNYFYRNRDAYFRTLQETRTRHRYDLTAFLQFGIRGFREELEKINAYVRNRTHRLQYRDLIRRCTEQRVGKRRRLLNDREAHLLHGLLDVSEPADPFSDQPAREAAGEDLRRLSLSLYRGKTTRTLLRELLRLEELGFIALVGDGPVTDWRVSIRFDAIERY